MKRTGGDMSKLKDVKKVVLAYSGGLDTSIILKWLQTELGAEVVTFTADLGQGEELEPARKKAEMLGIKEIYIEDVREEFVRDFVFPMFRANAQYEGLYLLGTSIARPLISKRLVEIAEETGADAIAHGATGKGNDQVRFELSAYALNPDIKVIAPWRDWTFKSRTDLINFAEQHQIPVAKDKKGEAPFSVDANLLHSSSEGKVLEDPWQEPPEYVHMRTISPMDAPDTPTELVISFRKGDAVAIDGKELSPATLLAKLKHPNLVGLADFGENDPKIAELLNGIRPNGERNPPLIDRDQAPDCHTGSPEAVPVRQWRPGGDRLTADFRQRQEIPDAGALCTLAF